MSGIAITNKEFIDSLQRDGLTLSWRGGVSFTHEGKEYSVKEVTERVRAFATAHFMNDSQDVAKKTLEGLVSGTALFSNNSLLKRIIHYCVSFFYGSEVLQLKDGIQGVINYECALKMDRVYLKFLHWQLNKQPDSESPKLRGCSSFRIAPEFVKKSSLARILKVNEALRKVESQLRAWVWEALGGESVKINPHLDQTKCEALNKIFKKLNSLPAQPAV